VGCALPGRPGSRRSGCHLFNLRKT
jgi:hypothetical protein